MLQEVIISANDDDGYMMMMTGADSSG